MEKGLFTKNNKNASSPFLIPIFRHIKYILEEMHIILYLAHGFVCLVSAWYLLLVGGSVNSTTVDRGHQEGGPVSVNHRLNMELDLQSLFGLL
jgi:hypothetical protein